MNIHAIYHVEFEGLGEIEPWVKERGYVLTETKPFLGEALPVMDSFDWLIVMGGPMNIYEEAEYPWLIAEKQLIRDAVKQNKKVLGICLGAQLLADALDAKVFSNPVKEIGWYPIGLTREAKEWLATASLGMELSEPLTTLCLCTDPSESSTTASLGTESSELLTVFHWHGDTFDLPLEAIPLAGSEGCRNQAFIYGTKAVGLQFHLEMVAPDIERLIKHGSDELVVGPYIQTAEEIRLLTSEHALAAQVLLHTLLLTLEQA
ncbi:MAG: type 1 glutamine amidotransferase [Gorillibacterium sp.]|nr:type 1 glutamine amidotransferase [Gorillibacterium sp.]